MAYANKLAENTIVPGRSPNVIHARDVYLPVVLLFPLLLVGAASSSGQDLGALAREERARKQAQPVQRTHTYTNDDLARPQILIPKDDAEFRSAQKKWKDSGVSAPPAPAAKPESAAVPLGEVARQYAELKSSRERQSPTELQTSHSSHVYTNEDLARPQILTPQDHAVFQAAQKKQPPGMEQGSSIMLRTEVSFPSAPLGAVARLYRHQKRVIEIQKQRGSHLPSGTPLLDALKIQRSLIPQSPGTGLVLQPIQSWRRDHVLSQPGNAGGRLITVKPGDSLWRLARQYLGKGSMWQALWKASPWIRDPNHLKVGVAIRI